jgi:hypothetical protein
MNSQKPWLKDVTTSLNKSRAYTYLDPPEGSIRTTEEIALSLTVQDGREINHSVAVAAPLELPAADLPIEPYLLGLWLGDGQSHTGLIGMAESDMREVAAFLPPPTWSRLEGSPTRKAPFLTMRFDGLTASLRSAGLIRNKHIPPQYKRASKAQRIALLQGLMDSDGTVEGLGQASFSNTNERLIDDTLELVNSLGIKATKTVGEAKIYDRVVSACYGIKFVAGFRCFQLERKAARQKLSDFRPTTQRRYIVSVYRVEPCGMKCVTVADPSGTYLIGRTFIPTHNSHAARTVVVLLALDPANAGTRWCILRRTYDLVRENHIEPLLTQWPFMRDWYRVGDKELLLPNKSVIAFRYAETPGDVEGMIGKEYRGFVVDQAEAFTERELITMKSCTRWPGVSASACKFILTFNPGGIGHSFLKRIFYDKRYKTDIQHRDTLRTVEQDDGSFSWIENPREYSFIQAFGWDNWEWAKDPLVTDLAHADGMTDDELAAWPAETRKAREEAACKVYYHWDADKQFDYFTKRTQHGRELNALPEAMRVGWLLGRMDQFAGQYYDIFSLERHVAPCRPAAWDTRWIGIDWGFAHLSACYWASQIEIERAGREPLRKLAYYREFCESGRSPRALAQEIVDRTPQEERPQVKHIFLSHDAFAKRTESDTIADQMAEVFRMNGMPYPEMASMDPKGRAALLYDLMGPQITGTQPPEYRTPEIVIDPSCRKLIEVLPSVCRDKMDPEKSLKFDGDDPFDGATHVLTYRLRKAAVPDEVLAMREIEKIDDPVARWFATVSWRRKHKATGTVVHNTVVMPWEREFRG